MIAVLLIVINLLASAQTVQIRNQRIYLQGSSCAALKNEAASIWEFRTQPQICSCQSAGRCSLDVTQTLPSKISELLLLKYTKISGPNCWNSVLLLSGMSPGLQYSEDEIEFWLSTPLCSVISPEIPRPGDIINFTHRGLSGHTTRFISNNLIFNKANSDKEQAYKALNFKSYLASKNISPQCQNVPPEKIKKLNCPNGEFSVYRCKNFEDYVVGQLTPEESKASEQMKQAARCLTAITLGKHSQNLPDDMQELSKVVKQLAKDRLRLPSLEDLDLQIRSEWERIIGRELNEDDLHYNCLLAQKDMSLAPQMEYQRKQIELVRKNKLYDFGPTKEFLIWSQIFLSTKMLEEEFQALN